MANSGPPDESDTKKFVSDWVRQARAVLVQLGGHIREVLRVAGQLAEDVMTSKAALDEFNQSSSTVLEMVKKADELMQESDPDLGAVRKTLIELKSLVEKSTANAATAQEAVSGAVESGKAMDELVTQTTQAMMSEARMMQDLGLQMRAKP